MDKKIGVGRAVGKVILMGEHAVVYGEPALSIPFLAARTEVIISESLGEVEIDCHFYRGLLKDSKEELLGIRSIIEKLVKDLNKELRNFKIEINTSIPVERGMGSSAAVGVAVTRALYDYFDEELSEEALIEYTDISEKIIHGNPSGLDAATIIGEKSLYYIKGEEFLPFNFKLDAYLVVADSGQIGNTREAVAGVKDLLDRDYDRTKEIIEKLGSLSKDSKGYLEENNPLELGRAMREAQRLLNSLGVSNDNLELLVESAMEKGALGAKLTGGGKGGSMIALASNISDAEVISKELISKGARETWISNLGVGVDD